MTKQDIRVLSREMNLPTWDKPADACLATRIPYGQKITPEKLLAVERAEQFLLDAGFRQVRVRHHGDTARIEVAVGERILLLEENILAGGFSSAVLELLNANGLKNNVLCLGLPDAYIQQGPAKILRERIGLCAEGALAALKKLAEKS